MGLIGSSDTGLSNGSGLYAVAYRPIVRDGCALVKVWPEPLAVGADLPTLPMTLSAEPRVPIDLESTYVPACQRKWLSAG